MVLGIALLFDLYSWKVSYRELFAGQSPSTTWLSRIRSSKDPSVFTVFLEDSAAIAGTIIVFFGILLSQVFHHHYFDGVASLMIGILLGGVALFLGRESGTLLLGESIAPETARRLKSLIESDPAVEQVGDLLTMHLGPEQVLLNVDIKSAGGLDVEQLEAAIDRLENRIRAEEPRIKRIFIKAEALKHDGRRPQRAA